MRPKMTAGKVDVFVINPSPGNVWLVIGVVGTISIYWYNTYKTKSEEKNQSNKLPLTPEEESQRRKELDEKRLEAAEKLQREHEKLSVIALEAAETLQKDQQKLAGIAEEKRRKKRAEELTKRLALIEYQNSCAGPNSNTGSSNYGTSKSTMNEYPANPGRGPSSTQTREEIPDNDTEFHGYGQEPVEDFISDFEFEYNMARRNGGGGTRDLTCSARVNGISREVVVDTGACLTIIHERLARSGRLQRVPTNLGLVGANGQPLDVMGAMKITLSVGDGFTVQHNALVSPSLTANVLLGCDFHSRHGLQVDFSTNTLKYGNGKRVQFSVN